MEYYILTNNIKQGPFSLEELKTKGITGNTLIWKSGLSEWIPAMQLAELQPFLLPTEQGNTLYIPPKTWLTESILVTIFCCLPFGIVGIIHASKVSSSIAAGNILEAQIASKNAKRWTKIGFFTGLAVIVLYTIIYGIVILTTIYG